MLQHNGRNSSNLGTAYEGTGNELCGGEVHSTDWAEQLFKIVEYEVFVVE